MTNFPSLDRNRVLSKNEECLQSLLLPALNFQGKKKTLFSWFLTISLIPTRCRSDFCETKLLLLLFKVGLIHHLNYMILLDHLHLYFNEKEIELDLGQQQGLIYLVT